MWRRTKFSVAPAVWSKTPLREQTWSSWWWVLALCLCHWAPPVTIPFKLWLSLWHSGRITRSSSGQKWRKWTLPAGCAKPWASTSPALPLAALNEEAPTALAHTADTQHLTHTQAITHIGTFLHLLLGLKKKKQTKKEEIFLWNLSPSFIYFFSPAAVTPRPPFSRLGCWSRLHHASVRSSSQFHEADVERKHWRAAELSSIDKLFFYCPKYCIDILYANSKRRVGVYFNKFPCWIRFFQN